MSTSVNQPTQPTIVVQSAKEPGCLIQAIWFLVVGCPVSDGQNHFRRTLLGHQVHGKVEVAVGAVRAAHRHHEQIGVVRPIEVPHERAVIVGPERDVERDGCGPACPSAPIEVTDLTAAVLALVVAGPAAAQATDEPSSKTFFTRRDGVIAASFLAASVGLSLFDARIAHYFRDTSLAHVRFGDKWDDVGAGLALERDIVLGRNLSHARIAARHREGEREVARAEDSHRPQGDEHAAQVGFRDGLALRLRVVYRSLDPGAFAYDGVP